MKPPLVPWTLPRPEVLAGVGVATLGGASGSAVVDIAPLSVGESSMIASRNPGAMRS